MNRELSAVYNRIRAEERASLDRRTKLALGRAPALYALSEERAKILRDTGAKLYSAAEGQRLLAEVRKKEQRALVDAGLPEDTLSLHYRCPDCRDTGYLDRDGKTPCKCLLKYAAELDALDAINAEETFLKFSEAVYPDEAQKKQALKAKAFCQSYAAALPAPEKPNLLILGTNGLGKSFLSNAIARAAIERGVDAVRVTAYQFTQDVMTDIKKNTQNAARFQSVPLFVLDDLGCEPIIPNVSNEWLFAVVNERMIHRKATVIVTNLDYEALGNRYGDRLLSRLVNRQTTVTLRLTGRDLRTTPC